MPKHINADDFKAKYLCCGYLPEMSEEEFDAFPGVAYEGNECPHCGADVKTSELKPCPFCGSNRIEVRYLCCRPYIICEKCHAQLPCYNTYTKAREAWNRRYENG